MKVFINKILVYLGLRKFTRVRNRICDICEGNETVELEVYGTEDHPINDSVEITCPWCNGHGKV